MRIKERGGGCLATVPGLELCDGEVRWMSLRTERKRGVCRKLRDVGEGGDVTAERATVSFYLLSVLWCFEIRPQEPLDICIFMNFNKNEILCAIWILMLTIYAYNNHFG